MSSDGGVASASSATWRALRGAIARHPALGALVVVAVPLMGAAAVFLAPFALPLGVVALVFARTNKGSASSDGEVNARVSERHVAWRRPSLRARPTRPACHSCRRRARVRFWGSGVRWLTCGWGLPGLGVGT